ncbi:MAG: UPF0280 family protein [Deltaproteobacteria bacterium]|jgi:ApbE superfamily uncharacterized protein (UPF0280 family)|nr:UPF0280 family protein [Deltaproteobacteria bacterium]
MAAPVDYRQRTYRNVMHRNGLAAFEVRHKETDLHVQADRDMSQQVSLWVIEIRSQLEEYIRRHPQFLTSYTPLPYDEFAPPVARAMLNAALTAAVGPMAAVAGAIAEEIGKRCLAAGSSEVIVENGGDNFVSVKDGLEMAIFAGDSPFSMRIGIRIPGATALGVCTSSGTIGHSRSLGTADAVTILAGSAALADAAATAVGNLVRHERDMSVAVEHIKKIDGVSGGVIIKGRRMGVAGDVELIKI